MSPTSLKRSEYETVKVTSLDQALSLICFNIDSDSMQVIDTTFLHDTSVEKRLEEIRARGLVAIPVIDHPISDCVRDGYIVRMNDLLLSNDGSDEIIAAPILWTDTAESYDKFDGCDGITPLRFGMVSQEWRRQIVKGEIRFNF